MDKLTETVELKPCPFCGGQGVKCFNLQRSEAPMYWVLCRDCHASPGSRLTEAEAVDAWNTRAALTPAGENEVERVLLGIKEQMLAISSTAGGAATTHGDPSGGFQMIDCYARETDMLADQALAALTPPAGEEMREALEPFAALGRVLEARARITFGRAPSDNEIVCESSGEVGVGILTMGHFRDAAALLPNAPGWGGMYRPPFDRAALRGSANNG